MIGGLCAISDLHIAYQENRAMLDRLRPAPDAD